MLSFVLTVILVNYYHIQISTLKLFFFPDIQRIGRKQAVIFSECEYRTFVSLCHTQKLRFCSHIEQKLGEIIYMVNFIYIWTF